MGRQKDERIEKGYEMYANGAKLIEISSALGVAEGTVRSWKSRYWAGNATLQKEHTRKSNAAKKAAAKKKRQDEHMAALTKAGKKKIGAPYGNHNATGPPGNRNAEKFGFYSKYLPGETKEIFDALDHTDPLDMLWDQIRFAYAAILRAQRIAYVKDQEDLSVFEDGKRIDYAWDKQSNFLHAQARAQAELRSLIRQYDEMLHANWDLATEEQKARIDKLRREAETESKEDIKIMIAGDLDEYTV